MRNRKLGFQETLHEVIFEATTPLGRLFDILLLWAIIISVGAVILESVAYYRENYGFFLRAVEWGFTIIFTIEYIFRILSVKKPLAYMTSFYGVIDALAIIPSYISLYVVGAQSLLVIRAFRLLRVFRIFKLGRYLGEANVLRRALIASRQKITVFLLGVLSVVLLIGTMMHLIEGMRNGFTSIPQSMYWAIVTMTTVGYGDVTPQTTLGQFLASIVMILGYGIIAVPTGIVSVELTNAWRNQQLHPNPQVCQGCSAEGHEADALYCRFCGTKL